MPTALRPDANGHNQRPIPQENIWQFFRQDYLSNRVFDTYAAIVDAWCAAWDALVNQPGKITSSVSRD